MPRAHQLAILTPDGIQFSLPLAGPAIRGLAITVDFLVVWAVLSSLQVVLAPFQAVLPDFTGGAFVLLQFACQVLYGIALELFWGGRTIGKKLLGLRVADERGLHLRPEQVIVRNLLRPIDALPFGYLAGGLAAFLSPKAQRLGDLAAGTVVIRTRHTAPATAGLEAGKFNSFRAHPAMEARLRQRTDPAEAALLARALTRRDTLAPESRLSLFADLSARFRAKVRFPEESTRGLTDEQYLRNAADSLFRSVRGNG